MLLFDESKKLEKALGEEAAAVIVHAFERADETWRQDLATKADLHVTKKELQEELLRLEMKLDSRMSNVKHDILRWMVGGFLAQTALLVAVLAFLR